MNYSVDTQRTWRWALQTATDALSAIEAPEAARLEAEVLLCHQLGMSRAQLYTHLDSILTLGQDSKYAELIQRRLRCEPVSYITEHREFFGLDFYVNRHVLIPRPETELLVEKALNWAKERETPIDGWRIADIGTGSGAIAVSLAVHLPESKIVAVDISNDALQVASVNCERHGVTDRILLQHGNLLTTVAEMFHIIVANLPYVTREELLSLSPDIRKYEPMAALDGGNDGLDLYRRLFEQAPRALDRGGLLLAEIRAGQGRAIMEIARQAFPSADVESGKDYAGLDRAVVIRSQM